MEYIIGIASDHAGFSYKGTLLSFLAEAGFQVKDLGVFSSEAADYPDVARSMADAINEGLVDKGILICGSGVGVCIAVNKFSDMRAGICHDTYSAHQGVEHDGMNVLCMGERIIGIELAKEIALSFLKARFSNEPRHVRRLNKVEAIERENLK